MSYLDRLAARVETVHTVLCVGIDPHPEVLPPGFQPNVAGIERYAQLLVEVAAIHAAAVKVNLAFFEAFGSAGMAALERIRANTSAEVPFIADAKRGDIGWTAARQAVALYEALGADAVTASPYLGYDAIEPFLERADRFVYVLCRTSNPGAAEVQGLDVAGEPLYVRVARRALTWADRADDNLGLVVGATAPDELSRVREVAPGLAFLVPGVGVQGGDVDAVLASGQAREGRAAARRGGGLLVNVSRAIADAVRESSDPERAVEAAAAHWASVLRC